MAVFTKQHHFDVNSDPALGAENVTANGAQFTINLEQSILLDKGGFEATIAVEEATVWNTVNNVSEALGNNHMFITDLPAGTIDVLIPDGNYSTSSLSESINRAYENLGGTPGIATLQEDFATQRVLLVIDGTLAGAGGAQVDFTQPNTCRVILGFDATLRPAAPTTLLVNILAPNTAEFNIIEYFLIHWDGGQGFSTNKTFQQTIARVNITARPGSQIVSQPFNPAKSEANGWIGERHNHLTFWLTDQTGTTLVDTGETWSARCVLEWKVFIDPPEPPGTAELKVQLPKTLELLRQVIGKKRRLLDM